MPTDYEALVQQVDTNDLGKALAGVLRVALARECQELASWCRLELLSYVSDNPEMSEITIVPEYRTVGGDWFDEYGRQLPLEDPKLSFINEIRLRAVVVELETLVGVQGTAALRLPEFAEVIESTWG